MTAPEFTYAVNREVNQEEQEYFTVQHRSLGVEDWYHETTPLMSAEEAVRMLEAHSDWYQSGNIRAVKKVVRTTIETLTTVVHNK